MRYYHGTDKSFTRFNLNEAQEYKDFGKGIYLAVGEEHARKIALKKNGEHAFVRVYDFSISDMQKNFNVKVFRKDNKDWINFVLQNRNRRITCEYDVIIGPTADANAQEKLENFYRIHKHRKPSHKDYNELRKGLQTQNFPHQMCIIKQEALNYVEKHLIKIYDLKEKKED